MNFWGAWTTRWLLVGLVSVWMGCGSSGDESPCGAACHDADSAPADGSLGSDTEDTDALSDATGDAEHHEDTEPGGDVSEATGDVDAGPAPTPLFREGTEELGLPVIYSSTASLVDVDLDGRVDLFIGGHTLHPESRTELFRNTADGFVALGLADRLLGDVPMIADIVATSIVDLNGDGQQDLLVGGYFDAHVQVLWNRGDLQFEPETLFTSPLLEGSKVASFDIYDLDQDGDLDLYVSLKYPDIGILPDAYTHPNIILLNDGAEGFEPVGQDIGQHLYECGSKQTFAALTIPRAIFGRPDLLHVANDFTFDCAYEADPTNFPSYVQPEGWSDLLNTFSYSMAIDYTYLSDSGSVLLAISDSGRQLMVTYPPDGPPTLNGLLLDDVLGYTGWGNIFLDADNDGDRDLVVASGIPFADEQYLQYTAQLLPQDAIALESMLFYFETHEDGSFSDESHNAGPWFVHASGEWYGLAQGDINGDGCIDVVATLRTVKVANPLRQTTISGVLNDYKPEDDIFVYTGPGTRVLLNNCPAPDNHWVGVVVPDVPGTIVSLELSDGSKMLEPVKGLVGVGARSGGGQLHFGLGPTRTPVSATVYNSKGEEIASTDALEIDTYNVVTVDE